MSGGDSSIIIIDSRTPTWIKRSGLIPGAVNIPFTKSSDSADTLKIIEDEFDILTGETFTFQKMLKLS